MHLITNIQGERLTITPTKTYRQCLDKSGTPIEDYYVSQDGSVMSTKRRKPHILNPVVDPRGRLYMPLQLNGKRTVRLVHHLVADAWIGPAPS
jgi:hypothetical protein